MINLNYNSHYKEHANKTLNWLPMDTKELYEKNIKENYNLLKIHNWIDNSFTYKFNSHGFRCNEFTSDPTIMFLGCSYTLGIGLPIETIWPEIVAKQLNLHCANLGIASGSADTAFRLCHGWIDIINPKILIFMLPANISRIEFVTTEFVENDNLAWADQSTNEHRHIFLKEWSGIDDSNSIFNSLKNTLAIKHLCNIRNIKYIEISAFTLNDIPSVSFMPFDLARDLAHPGVGSNAHGAQIILSNI